MTRTPPQHGQRACYLRGCRRPECAAAHKRYCKEYDLRVHREGRRNIDATPAAEHLKQLASQKWTQEGLAKAIGCGTHTVCSLLNGNQKKIRPETAARILAFQPTPNVEPGGYWTDSTGTTRRLRALAAIGHPLYQVADAVGIDHGTIRPIAAGTRQKVSKALASRVARLYATLVRQPGPSPTARGIARARGWHGPAAWGEDIDNPAATPETDQEATDLDSRRELAALRRAEIEHLDSFNVPEHEIADRLGMARAYVHDLIRDMRKERFAKPAVTGVSDLEAAA
ncbi:hypothetical protein OIU81_03200 [Streptomyces sp. NBC_01454]|uniref:hypothetical protein n=1 Tax=Streptomyces sp. NBC_01454 TaxID=2975867 RepID=UPI002E343122|nr:hypothetical protein [Streptomyces sp. NBC_01454]